MIRWLLAACFIVPAIGLANSAQAKGQQLYRVQRPASHSVPLPGKPVPGLDSVRIIDSSEQVSLLTLKERASLQKNITYQSLFTPNDPHYSLQWNIQAMNVPAAWDVDQVDPLYGGDSRVIVAVLDTGIASTIVGGSQSVPDIAAANIWTNPSETAGDGIDNDGDGYIDDMHGWNFVANTAQPADDNGHGTHISGVIAGAMNNAVATAGIASNVTIMPLKVLDQHGSGLTTKLTAAIQYAVKHGASIINLSLGGNEDDPIFHQAIQTAAAQGIIIVAAAGNSGESTVKYPAGYTEVIGVGATNTDSSRASYSNYGSGITLVAPGGDTALDLNADGQPDGIPSQSCVDGSCSSFATIYLSGTSQAASEVSAVAALLASCGAPPGNIRQLLTTSATDIGVPGRDDVFGYGLVNAAAALTSAGCVITQPSSPSAITATASNVSSLAIYSHRPYPFIAPVFHWSGQSGLSYSLTWKKGSTVMTQTKQTAATFSPTVSSEGSYTLSVATVDGLGQVSTPQTFVYRYQKPVIITTVGSAVQLLTSELKTLRSFVASAGKTLSVTADYLDSVYSSRLLIASSQGATLSLTDTQGKVVKQVQPFGKNFPGALSAQVLHQSNGSSMVVAATNTKGANIVWLNSAGKVLAKNLVFSKYTGGVNIATGDFDGDGNEELAVAQSTGPEIRIYNASQQRTAQFFPRGKNFTQGWSITAGDTNGDGLAEIIITPNVPGTGQKVLFFNGAGKEMRQIKITGSKTAPMLLQALDVTGDGKLEIVTMPQKGAGTLQVLSASGKVLKQSKLSNTSFRSLTRL